MYTEENYFWGLVIYGLGVLLMMPAMIKVTGFIMPWKPLRVVLRVFFVALLVTPVYAYKDVEFLAPAWVVAPFELVRPTSEEGPAMAFAAFSAVFASGLLLVGAFYLLRHFLRRRHGHQISPPAPESDTPPQGEPDDSAARA